MPTTYEQLERDYRARGLRIQKLEGESEQQRKRADVAQAAHDGGKSAAEGLVDGIKRMQLRLEEKDDALKTVTAQVARLVEALKEHHQWHQNLGTIGIGKDPEDGEWIELDMSLEYSDSPLYEKTEAALSPAPPAEKPNQETICTCGRGEPALCELHGEPDGPNPCPGCGRMLDLPYENGKWSKYSSHYYHQALSGKGHYVLTDCPGPQPEATVPLEENLTEGRKR